MVFPISRQYMDRDICGNGRSRYDRKEDSEPAGDYVGGCH